MLPEGPYYRVFTSTHRGIGRNGSSVKGDASMDAFRKDNQMYRAGMLYFDPVYREKKEEPKSVMVNGVLQFSAPASGGPYREVKPAKLHDDGSVTVSIYEP